MRAFGKLAAACAVALSLSWSAASFGHMYTVNDGLAVELSTTDLVQAAAHEDDAPFKGLAYVGFKNTSSEAWRGVHFEFWPSSVGTIFGDRNDANEPVITLEFSNVPGLSITSVDLAADKKSFDVFFAPNMDPGKTAFFYVYTDNTLTRETFGLAFKPIAVPEPASFGLLALGGLLLRRRR